MQGYVYDIEADNLYIYSSKIWILHAISLDGTREFTLFPYEMEKQDAKRKFLEWHNSFGPDAIVSSFNGIGFDHWVLWKYLDISFHIGKGGKDWLDREIPVKIIDLLLLSQMIDPDRPSHSLASYGEQFGDPKIEFDAFHQYSDEMLTYCKQDVKLTLKVFNYLVNKLQLMYRSVYKEEYDEDNPPYQAGLRALHKDYYLYAAQEITGIKFNQDKARKLLEDCAAEMKALEDEVLPQLPPRKLKEGEKKHYSLPAKPFKKDGSLSSTMEKWLTKHSAVFNAEENTVNCYGRDWPVVSNFLMDIQLPMEIKDGDDIKEWLMSKNWVPTFWNFKRDPDTGKPMRGPDGEVITTSPKIQEAGKICPNLLEIDGELPKKIVKFLSLRNRASVVTGWLENPRLAIDGKIGASITGYTPTFRVKHNVIVNLPKASPEVVKGFEMRDLFEADEGRVYVSADAAALENRTVADYTYEFDNGEFAKRILEGDSHSFNAKAFFPEQTKNFDPNSPTFNKDAPEFKPFRNKAKNGGYCLPKDTKVLTSSGWVDIQNVKVNDAVLSYNAVTGLVEKDIVLSTTKQNLEVFEFSNHISKFKCTGNHRWYGWKRVFNNKKRIKSYGFFEADDLRQENNILLNAPYVGGDSKVSIADARLMGYLLSDGSFSWSKKSNRTSASNGVKKYVEGNISQAIHKFYEKIESSLEECGVTFSKYIKEVRNNNHVINYSLKSPTLRPYLERTMQGRYDKHEYNWSEWVVSLSREALEAFYEAFYEGDGTLGTQETISQNRGKIFDAMVIAAQLIGHGRVTVTRSSDKANTCEKISIHKKSHMTMQEVTKKSLGTQETYCLSTFNSTFIIWQDDFIGITGNCLNYGGGAPKLAKTLGISAEEGQTAYDNYWRANYALKLFKESCEDEWKNKGLKKYILGRDGKILSARSKHLLVNLKGQNLGATVMTYAFCLMDNRLGWLEMSEDFRPHYTYKGQYVARCAAFHDQGDFVTDEGISEEVGQMLVQCIVDAGELLNMQVPLAGEYKTGKTAAEIH